MISPARAAGDSPRTPALTAETGPGRRHRGGPDRLDLSPPSTSRRGAGRRAPHPSPPISSRPKSAFGRSPSSASSPGTAAGTCRRVAASRRFARATASAFAVVLRSGEPRRGSAAHPRPARARAERPPRADRRVDRRRDQGDQEPRRHTRADGGAPRRPPDRAGAHRASDRGQAPDRALEAPAHRRDASQPARPRSAAPGARRGARRTAGRDHRALADRALAHRPARRHRRGAHRALLRRGGLLDALPRICLELEAAVAEHYPAWCRRPGGSRSPRGSAATATAIRRW